MPYRLVDHTADLAIEATGPSRDAVLQDAALGLTQVLAGIAPDRIGAQAERKVSFHVDAPDPASLVVAFLSELLWLHESEDLLWLGGRVAVSSLDDGGVRAQAEGQALVHDPTRHGRGVEVKAVTYHGLEFGAGADGQWRLWVLLDV